MKKAHYFWVAYIGCRREDFREVRNHHIFGMANEIVSATAVKHWEGDLMEHRNLTSIAITNFKYLGYGKAEDFT